MMRIRIAVGVLTVLMLASSVVVGDQDRGVYRWQGKEFAFCFTSDDGTICNLGWADLALANDFRFTIAVNPGLYNWTKLTAADLFNLHQAGFEIAQHGWSHGYDGLDTACTIPPRGSWVGYYGCDCLPGGDLMVSLHDEIDRGRLADFTGIPEEDVLVAAYPRHLHNAALIDELIAEGYRGARFGHSSSYVGYGSGDFTTPPSNSWEGGISLFRVPVAQYATYLFGDHSAVPPVHFTYEQFLARALPLVEQAQTNGGIFSLYSHHFGDDDDSYGNINYGSSGMTPQDLLWIVELARAYGGEPMTFGDAVEFYRSRSEMHVIAGDYVWIPEEDTAVPAVSALSLEAAPNPFNPSTRISWAGAVGRTRLTVYDLRGRLVAGLRDGEGERGSVVWNGLDREGRSVTAGVYMLRLEDARGALVRRVTLTP